MTVVVVLTRLGSCKSEKFFESGNPVVGCGSEGVMRQRENAEEKGKHKR